MDYQLFETHKSQNHWIVRIRGPCSGQNDYSCDSILHIDTGQFIQGSLSWEWSTLLFCTPPSMRTSLEMPQPSLEWWVSGPQDYLEQRGNSSLVSGACPAVPVISAGTFLRSRPIHSPKTGLETLAGVSISCCLSSQVIIITQQHQHPPPSCRLVSHEYNFLLSTLL